MRVSLVRWLRPGWPDEARFVAQAPVFRKLLRDNVPRGSCLNAGCGEGLFLSFLGSFPELTRIVHLDLQALDLSGQNADARHRSVSGSLTELPFGDGEFDFVFCTEVLEHIADDLRALHEVARVLRRGGRVLLSTPTPPAPKDPNHVREGYTLPELRDKLAAAGIEITTHAFCFHLPMRALLKLWQWQNRTLKGGRNWLPKGVVVAFGYCDRWLPLGRAWDLVVLGIKK